MASDLKTETITVAQKNEEQFNLQKRVFLGWTSVDLSSVQGMHIFTPITEKEKLRIIQIDAPEDLSKDERCFPVTVHVRNEGNLDMTVWSQIDFTQKPSIFPELEQLSIASGFISERFELGHSKEIIIQPGENVILPVSCYLRQTEQDSSEFTIETQLYTNIQGRHYLVDVSTLHGIFHEQSLMDEHGLTMAIVGLGFLFALLLIVVIIRVAYPAYYIKRHQLQKEKERIQRHRRNP